MNQNKRTTFATRWRQKPHSVGLLWVVLTFVADPVFAAQVEIQNLRMWPAPDHTRVVFDLAGSVEHNLFVLGRPNRVVLDFKNAKFSKKPPPAPGAEEPLIKRIRSAPRNQRDTRVVLDLKQSVRPRSFLLKPNQKYGYRLVVDLFGREGKQSLPPTPSKSVSVAPKLRDIVVAIDAGHGGEDPGATGRRGTREKKVVLDIARKMELQLRRERGFRPVMIRRGDYYIGLRKRIAIAREHRADLFVSIHADAFPDARVKGSSVYVLSRNGASSEAARWLAKQENAADLVGGVSLDDKDQLLASVLLDLSQTATLSASDEMASQVLTQFRSAGRTRRHRVERAGFAVLKSPDIPSVLVETAFLTNPTEERHLRDPKHQSAIASAIVKGILAYFRANAPAGTLLAARRHTITRGETLGGIAQRYNVTINVLRRVNGLSGDKIQVGEVLEIPRS